MFLTDIIKNECYTINTIAAVTMIININRMDVRYLLIRTYLNRYYNEKKLECG